MTVASILSCGISLKRTLPQAKGCLIAVNRSWEACDHDWWCCGDAGAMQWPAPYSTKIGVCSVMPTPAGRLRQILWHELPLGIEPVYYSVVAALALAWKLGHNEILVFGHDQTGDNYFNGDANSSTDSDRWKIETGMFNSVVAQIHSLGGKVTRIR